MDFGKELLRAAMDGLVMGLKDGIRDGIRDTIKEFMKNTIGVIATLPKKLLDK